MQLACVFITPILALFCKNSNKKKIHLDQEFQKDIALFCQFLPRFNGVTYFKKFEVDQEQMLFLDTSLTALGGVWRKQVHATPVRQI